MEKNEELQILELFVKDNTPEIHKYINEYVFKGIATINMDYFNKLVNNVFEFHGDLIFKNNCNRNFLPYWLFTFAFGSGQIAYTSLRSETINFEQLNKEAKAYYNYVEFKIEEQDFIINLMQSKIGGMPIDQDIIKYTKKVKIPQNGIMSNFEK